LRTALTIFTVVALSALAGCNGAAEKKELFAVSFEKGQALRYRFVSSRDIDLDWGSTEGRSAGSKAEDKKFSESLEMVVSYLPVEVDPNGGFTTVKATCESVKARREPREGRRKDAVESLAGKSFTFTVDATGNIEDYSQLDELIKEAGKKAFVSDRGKRRNKEPDMIGDFIGSQRFLWDSVSSIENPFKGVSIGQSWNSKLLLPTPLPRREARDVTYTLAEIRQTEQGRLGVINSSYALSEAAPRSWPNPYGKPFQMKGRLGFFGFFGYKIADLQGQGEELFNMDAGRIEQYNQQYKLVLKALVPLAGADVQMTVKQKITMQLLGNR